MKKQLKADIALLLITIGWGSSFLLTKNAIVVMPVFNFLSIRFIIAFLISASVFYKQMLKIDAKTIKYGIIIGITLYAVYAFQTIGLRFTMVSKSAFVTGFNVVLVPVFSSILIKAKVDKKTYVSVIIAFIGLALMTLNKNLSGINIGDFLTLICAVINAFNLILISRYAGEVKSIPCAIIQIGVVAILSLITSIGFEKTILPTSLSVWGSILVLSVICTSAAFIVQNVVQKYTSATHAALIFSGEPVFAAMFAFIFYKEILSIKGFIGATMILAGMLLPEIDFKTILKPQATKTTEEV
jgi:drug/metabolite transporter (DMT)-like permease